MLITRTHLWYSQLQTGIGFSQVPIKIYVVFIFLRENRLNTQMPNICLCLDICGYCRKYRSVVTVNITTIKYWLKMYIIIYDELAFGISGWEKSGWEKCGREMFHVQMGVVLEAFNINELMLHIFHQPSNLSIQRETTCDWDIVSVCCVCVVVGGGGAIYMISRICIYMYAFTPYVDDFELSINFYTLLPMTSQMAFFSKLNVLRYSVECGEIQSQGWINNVWFWHNYLVGWLPSSFMFICYCRPGVRRMIFYHSNLIHLNSGFRLIHYMATFAILLTIVWNTYLHMEHFEFHINFIECISIV